MEQSVRERLEQLAEPAYREFSAGLLPGTGNILGVRLPRLRALAKELARGDWRAALEQEDVFFEETMLRGMVIGAARLPRRNGFLWRPGLCRAFKTGRCATASAPG